MSKSQQKIAQLMQKHRGLQLTWGRFCQIPSMTWEKMLEEALVKITKEHEDLKAIIINNLKK